MSFLKKLWLKIGKVFSKVEEHAAIFADSVVRSIAENGGPVLIAAAIAAVKAAEAQGGSGKDKLLVAQATIIGALKTAGIPIVMNAVNAAIEAAVANLKAK